MQLKIRARENPDEQPRQIIRRANRGLRDDEAEIMPESGAMERTIQRVRYDHNARTINCPELTAIQFYGKYKRTKNDKRFLAYDSRIQGPGLPIFFIFMSRFSAKLLKEHSNWAGDGTFKTCPNNMLQLYTVNALIRDSSVPCVFIFMEDRSQETYLRVFSALSDKLGEEFLGPDSFLSGLLMYIFFMYTVFLRF